MNVPPNFPIIRPYCPLEIKEISFDIYRLRDHMLMMLSYHRNARFFIFKICSYDSNNSLALTVIFSLHWLTGSSTFSYPGLSPEPEESGIRPHALWLVGMKWSKVDRVLKIRKQGMVSMTNFPKPNNSTITWQKASWNDGERIRLDSRGRLVAPTHLGDKMAYC